MTMSQPRCSYYMHLMKYRMEGILSKLAAESAMSGGRR